MRARVTILFGLSLLVLSGAFASITYFATSSYLVNQERSTLEQQAFANADFVRNSFAYIATSQSVYQLLGQLDTLAPHPAKGAASSAALLYFSKRWYHSSAVDQDQLPTAFKTAVENDESVVQTFDIGGQPHFAVGLQIPALGPTTSPVYVAIFNLASTANSLRVLLASLISAALVVTVAGAVLGRWASGRALLPLRDASRAALAIAGGQFDTRLDSGDVSDLAVLASSFNRMADRLQQRIERDARFTSDVSHELRSPLTVLANSLSVLESRRDELPPRAQQAVDLVAAEVRRFQRMVADLLEISRIDAGSAELDLSVVQVGELVDRVARTIGRGTLPISVPDDVAGLYVAVDKRRVERVIANLVDNAERYAGGAICIGAERRQDHVALFVDDEGPGVEPQDRERIFERFSRGSFAAGSRGAGGGTGLGLALVAEHVKLHGGRVWVEDNEGGGARFVVELPLAAPPEDGEDSPGSAAVPASDAPQRSPRPRHKVPTAGAEAGAASRAPGTGDGATGPAPAAAARIGAGTDSANGAGRVAPQRDPSGARGRS